MKLKFNITPELKDKFSKALYDALNQPIRSVSIYDIGDSYQFRFVDDVSSWHMELDKNPHDEAWYTLHCSNQKLELPLRYITNIKLFCMQIVRIKQMQSNHVKSR